MSAPVTQTIADAANSAGIPPSLALQVAFQESSFNPSAVGTKGEQGLFQLMPATAAAYGVTNPLDPAQNAAAGTQYLADLFAQFGDWATALTAFNWGLGNVAKYGAAAAPVSTQQYVAQALAGAGDFQATITPISIVNGLVTATAPAAPDDSGDSDFQAVEAGVLPSNGTPNYFLLALAALGVYIAWDFFAERG